MQFQIAVLFLEAAIAIIVVPLLLVWAEVKSADRWLIE